MRAIAGWRALRAGAGPLLALAVAIQTARAVPPCAGRYSTEAPVIGTSPTPPSPWLAEGASRRTTARLELKPDGRFAFTLENGAQDETGEGRWRAGEDRVILSGDAITAPAFAVVAEEALDEAVLRIDLDLPNGLSRQYFTAAVRLADGTVIGRGFTDATFALPVGAGNPPRTVRIDVPTLKLSSAEFALGAGHGRHVRIRFTANDLGKIAFADTPLIERDGALMLSRPGGDIALRREGRCSAE